MDIPDYMVDVMEEEELYEVRAPKRYIRDAQNPLEFYSEAEFRRRFRFSKDSVASYILPRIEGPLRKDSNRGLPFAPMLQLLLALRFYATSSFQVVVGDLSGISQPSASRIVSRISTLLAQMFPHYVAMPRTAAQQAKTKRLFSDLQRRRGHPDDCVIPNILGAIDCSHVRLASTKFEQIGEVYRNRKSYFSLNVQAVVGPHMEFFDVVPNWPGSIHDSRIFQNSRIRHRLTSGELPGALLGDSGYRSEPYLFTPFLDPETRPQVSYNRAQKRGRNVVERAFGVWKRRFPCVSKGLATKLETTTSIIIATTVLHNMSLIVNDIWNEDEGEQPDEVPVQHAVDLPADGLAARREILRLYFEDA